MKRTPPARRRRQGRPDAADSGVSKEALLKAARELIHERPPSSLSIASIARAASVDPALVRYHFGSRAGLMLAVVEEILGRPAAAASPRGEDAAAAIRASITSLFKVTRSARYMQRLMIDEFASSESALLRDKARDINARAIDSYATLRRRDRGRELVPFDPLFLHLAIVALGDFFMTARPIIEASRPDADMDELGRQYEAFVMSLVLDGLRRR